MQQADAQKPDEILQRVILAPCYSGDDAINTLQRIRDEEVRGPKVVARTSPPGMWCGKLTSRAKNAQLDFS